MPKKNNSSAKATPKDQAPDEQLSGLEVGRLILRDLAKAYENLAQGGPEQGLLTDQKRLELVAGLRGPEEIHQFNQFRYLHEYLTRANLAFAAHRQTASACFWQIRYYLQALRERLSEHDRLWSLRLLTRKQHRSRNKEIGPLFQEETASGPPVAVLEPQAEETLAAYIDERGGFKENALQKARFQEAAPEWAEILSRLPQALKEYKQAVREELVIEAAVEIISRFVEVPEMKSLIGRVDLEEFATLNLALGQAAEWPLDIGDPAAEAELKAALVPLDLAALAPSEAARRQARRNVDFTTVQGQIKTFYHCLRS